jgi:hypothetical protein
MPQARDAKDRWKEGDRRDRRAGIAVAPLSTMTTTHAPRTTDKTLLHWVLQRGAEAMTCEIGSHGRESFDVQVTLAWCDSPVLTERFHTPLAALERHAEVTALLQDAGWVVTQHTAPGSSIAA